ncbi:BrnT family toxin [Rhizobium sp. IY2]|uniref:BrnT family toxin n=1 Tax=Rhizobium sp. IY2 TaxID=3397853 RepID=UPI0039E18EC9
MKITWDEAKRIANLQKHGFDFEDVYFFDWKNAVITTSHGGRFKAIGYYEDGTAVVVYALLGSEAVSIISFRPASNTERKVLS